MNDRATEQRREWKNPNLMAVTVFHIRVYKPPPTLTVVRYRTLRKRPDMAAPRATLAETEHRNRARLRSGVGGFDFKLFRYSLGGTLGSRFRGERNPAKAKDFPWRSCAEQKASPGE